ncbi:MAG: antitoxin [Candidatus Omnitrophota bacterium]|jgi:predicted DNA binding CopG/RHH family protein
MRKIKLTRAEKSIEESLEQFVPVDKNEYEQIVQAIASRRKDAVLNIRVNRNDLKSIKHKANKLGIKYQTFISEILHRVAEV